jgi:hypothetical protein
MLARGGPVVAPGYEHVAEHRGDDDHEGEGVDVR